MKVFKISTLVTVLLLVLASFSFGDEVKVESVTVTANKIEENVQDVSISTSVFTDENIDDFRIDSLKDLSDYVPNFVVFESGMPGANAPIMRGMYADIETFTVSTGLYIDGVPALMGFGFESDLSNVERVEVLRGPQGTLYGKNAQAGVINIITKKPGNEFMGKVKAEYGVDENAKLAMNYSGPIKRDKLYFGVSASHAQRKGWVEDEVTGDTIDDERHFTGSGKLRWTPTENLEITFQAFKKRYNDEQPHMNRGPVDGSAVKNRKVALDYIGYNNGTDTSQSLKIDYDLGDDLKLSSITSNRIYNDDSSADFDFVNVYPPGSLELLLFKDNRYRKKSQEIKISSVGSGINWVAGLYGDMDDDTQNYRWERLMDYNNSIEGYSYSVFSHLTIPFGDKLRALGGIRYDFQNRKMEKNQSAGDMTMSFHHDKDWTEVSPKAGVEYDFTKDNMVYATASKGYLSGGFNPFVSDAKYQSYDEERLWSYELGSKNAFFNDKLIFNAAVYFMDIENLQVQEVIDGGESYTTNSPEADGYGIELDFIFKPLRGLSLAGSYGYNIVEFGDFKDSKEDYTGNTKPYAPEYTFSFGAKYRSALGFYCAADVTGCGKMYTDKNNTFQRDAYQLFNVKIGYETEEYDIYLFGDNIFDEEYDLVDAKGYYTFYSRPMEAGIAVSFRL